MDLRKARLFGQVAAAGSLSKAATLLDIQQSVVSRSIGSLERDVGGRLFHRTGRGVTLTELGERILPTVRSLLLQADQLDEEIRATAGVPTGEVRVGILPSMAHPLVSDLYRTLRQDLPGVRLRIDEGSGGQLADWIADGSVDIAVLFRESEGGKDDASHLRRVAMHLVAPAGDALTQGSTVAFAKLAGLPMVLPGVRSGLRALLDQLARRRNITLNVALEANSVHVQKDIVADGGAYTVLTFQAVHREVREGRLSVARIVSPVIERTVALRTTKHRALSAAVREVTRLVRQLIAKMPAPMESSYASVRRSTKRPAASRKAP